MSERVTFSEAVPNPQRHISLPLPFLRIFRAALIAVPFTSAGCTQPAAIIVQPAAHAENESPESQSMPTLSQLKEGNMLIAEPFAMTIGEKIVRVEVGNPPLSIRIGKDLYDLSGIGYDDKVVSRMVLNMFVDTHGLKTQVQGDTVVLTSSQGTLTIPYASFEKILRQLGNGEVTINDLSYKLDIPGKLGDTCETLGIKKEGVVQLVFEKK